MNLKHSFYEEELDNLQNTYAMAMDEDISGLIGAIEAASESSIIGVGSGGSYTVSSLLCTLHEAYTGRVSRSSTPLEIISNPNLASTSPVFLISAEGNNPDIIETLKRARQHSARFIHVLTNKNKSKLMDCISSLTDINPHVFELDKKDGYLATNSLLMDSLLIARVYEALDQSGGRLLPPTLQDLNLFEESIDDWLNGAADFINSIVKRKNIIVIYSPLMQPIAIDFESKLSEAALLFSQFADFRSFAHGRHLWFSDRPDDCAVLAIVDPSVEQLWDHMSELVPKSVPKLTLKLGGCQPRDILAGLVTQMKLVGRIAKCMNKDPGRPEVPQFGRELYYADLPELVPKPNEAPNYCIVSKFDIIGSRWPYKPKQGAMQRAYQDCKNRFEQQIFQAIVFDYDGTLCSSQKKNSPPSELVLEKLIKLLDSGVIVGIATGRGGSIQEELRKVLPKRLWENLILGLYNGGEIIKVSDDQVKSNSQSEFLNHVVRIISKLKTHGAPIKGIHQTQPYQVSVRFREGISTRYMWIVIADALREAGLDQSRMVYSKHSVDILSEGIGKSLLIAHIIQNYGINPYNILTMGDQGAWPGNDSQLLEHRFSLSVDVPSRKLDKGWNFAPLHKRYVDATLWYLERLTYLEEGKFKISFNVDALDK